MADPSSVPDVVAAALNVTLHAQHTVGEHIADALAGRRLLVVLDNCEHVLAAAADISDVILSNTTLVRLLATSRESLRLPAEQLWPVPPLDVSSGTSSAAVELFVERARAVTPGFEICDSSAADAVLEICRRLDGVALAIELAAARMVAMTPEDVRAHLSDRFRLLSGPRRGGDRHHALRDTIAWSYDLLDSDERALLARCAVFADGFDLAAARHICGRAWDDFTTLDVLESLVRKSLVTIAQIDGHARYGMLETIRQYAEEQLESNLEMNEIRNRHAAYFAELAVAHWAAWDSPQQRTALDWLDAEFANLRAAYRWASRQEDIATAAAIAAHSAMLAFTLQRYEPVAWAEELLDAATAADLPQLPRAYTAASVCLFTGRPENGVRYAQAAVALEADSRYDPFEAGWSKLQEASAHAYAGRADRYLEICTDLTCQSGHAHLLGLCAILVILPVIGQTERAITLAEEALTKARAYGNPYWIALALYGYGRAFTVADPSRALAAMREGLDYSREHRLMYRATRIAQELPVLEALHGEFKQSLMMFDMTIDSLNRAGERTTLAAAYANLAVLLDRLETARSCRNRLR